MSSPPLDEKSDHIWRIAEGQWDIRYQTTDDDQKSSRELSAQGFVSNIWQVLVQLGLPLTPSLVVLLAAQMIWAAATLACVFVIFAVYCAAHPRRQSAETLQFVEFKIRATHLDTLTTLSTNRRAWSLFEQVTLKPSWLCLNRNETTLIAIPRRLFDEDSLRQLVADLTSHIDSSEDKIALTPLDVGEMTMTDPFTFTTKELNQLLTGNVSRIEGEPAASSGFLTMLIVLMMGAGAAISLLPVTAPRKMVMWSAVCAAMWLPRLMWVLLEKQRTGQLLGAFRELEEKPRRHGIGERGFTDVWEQAQEVWEWKNVSQVKNSQDFILIYGQFGALYATPKRALTAPQEMLDKARRYWQAANPTETHEMETYVASPPGPAVESGNPYQPPTGDNG